MGTPVILVCGKLRQKDEVQSQAGLQNKIVSSRAMVHTFNPSTGRQRQVDLCELEANLVYRVNSRTDSIATEKLCLEKPKKTEGVKNLTSKKEGRLWGLSG